MTSRPIKIAAFCAAFPLLAGTLIYVTWRVTEWWLLPGLGMMTIGAGVPMVGIGTVCLLWHLWLKCKDGEHYSLMSREMIVVSGLLLANVPIAAVYTLSAIHVLERYTVTVINESQSTVESFLVTGPGVSVEFGPIAPGASSRRHLHFKGEGGLMFSARHQGRSLDGEIEGYVTGGPPSHNATVRIRESGPPTISREERSGPFDL